MALARLPGIGALLALVAACSSSPSTSTQGNVDVGRGINAVLAVHSIRAVTGDTEPIASEGGNPFPYLVLDLPGTELDEAYVVVDNATGESIGIQTAYSQWWTDDAGNTVGRELLLRVQDVGQDYYWLTYLTELAESSKSVRIGDRDVTVYRIPDEKIEEGSYDLDVFYWVEEPGVEAILIPWGLSGDGASGLMAGLKVLSVDEWIAQAGPAPDPENRSPPQRWCQAGSQTAPSGPSRLGACPSLDRSCKGAGPSMP